MKDRCNNYLKFVLLISSVCLLLNSCGGERLHLKCDYNEAAESGKEFYQPLINALENYKADHKNYPESVFELVPKYIDKIPGTTDSKETANSSDKTGKLYSHKNIKSQIIGSSAESNYYAITFYFRDNGNCLLDKNGVCRYNSSNKAWLCE